MSKQKAEQLISRAEAGRRLNVSGVMVSKYVELGAPCDTTGKIPWPRFRIWIQKHVVPELSGNPDGTAEPPDSSFSAARARKEQVLFKLRELELKQKAGELVSASEVQAEWVAVCTSIRDAMLAVPTRVAPRLVGLTDVRKIELEMRAAIRAELSRISDQLGVVE